VVRRNLEERKAKRAAGFLSPDAMIREPQQDAFSNEKTDILH
jgi:hypothetical protein